MAKKLRAPEDFNVVQMGGLVYVEDGSGNRILQAEAAGEQTLTRLTFVDATGPDVKEKKDHPVPLRNGVRAALRQAGYKLTGRGSGDEA